MKLTSRQRQVVLLLSEGHSCPQIARKLRIAVSTVRQHIRKVAEGLEGAESGVPALRRVRRKARELLEAA